MNHFSVVPAYLYAGITMAIAFGLAVIVSNLILFKPDNPGTTARRIWFWSLGFISLLAGIVINCLIAEGINVPSNQGDYHVHTAIAGVLFLVLYIIAGFATSKIFPNSKVGTWF